MSIDHSTMHLGKRPRRHDARTLRMARYLAGAGQAPLQPPASVDYTRGITTWGMMLNDQLGCCTIAAVGHAVQAWTANADVELTVPDSVILQYYEQWDGYNPANPSSDQGGVELDVLNNWRQQGFNGQTLDAYVAIDLKSGDGSPEPGVRGPQPGVAKAVTSDEWRAPRIGAQEPQPRVNTRNSGFRIPNSEMSRPNSETNHPDSEGSRPDSETNHPDSEIRNPATALTSLGAGAHPACQPTLSVHPPALSAQPPAPLPDVATAIWLFGGAYIGVELPITAQNQEVWDVPKNPGPNDEPGSWGGHAVYLVGYDSGLGTRDSGLGVRSSGLGTEDSEFRIPNPESRASGPESPASGPESPTPSPGSPVPHAVSRIPYPGFLTCITWGQVKKMTWAWFEKYCSEAYALVSKDWLKSSGVAPSGLDLETLESDLKLVTSP